MKDALGGQNLLSIYGVYEKLKGKSTASTQGSSSAQEGKPSTSTIPKKGETGGPTEESEKLKGQGNVAMQKKDYATAIDLYTKALEVAPLNPIYLSNRAAAYSAQNEHQLAKNDAELATVTDPKYSKGWSRLGLARFALGDAQGSMDAYQQGVEAEGNGGTETMRKGLETARRKVEAQQNETGVSADIDGTGTARSAPPGGVGGMPDLSSLASMFGGGSGGGGGGGMPDLGALMQNPMMRQMAQNLMSNPNAMNNLMNNPQLRNMAERFGGGGGQGGGMPNLDEMMNDPSLAEM